MRKLYSGAATAVVACALLYSGTAMAQAAAPEAPAAADEPSKEGLSEIVVTAQRRSESSQKAAIAIDVVDASALEKAQVTSPAQLANLVPSLQIGRAGGGNVSFFLRGVGTFTANSYTDSAVAFNYDGVYISRPSATTGYFYDVARVEVLKGPQGTLYGRNATGGAINIIPVAPKLGETSGYFSGTYGNYDSVNLQGAVNLGLSDTAALRISGTYVDRDGFNTDGSSDEKSRGIRGQLAFEPTPDLKISLSADYFKRLGIGSSSTIIARAPFNPFTNTISVVPTGLALNTGSRDPLIDTILSTTFNGIAGRTLLPLSVQSSLDGEFWGTKGQVDWKTGIGTFTVVAAHRAHNTDDITNGAGFLVVDKQDLKQDSLEVRLAGDAGPVGYLIGGFLYRDTLKANYAPLNQAINTYQAFTSTTDSDALFGRLTFHVSDRFRLVGGLRYTKDRKAIVGSSDTLIDICTAPTGQCPGTPLIPFSTSVDQAIGLLGLVPVIPGALYIQPTPAAANTIFIRSTTPKNDRLSEGRVTWRAAAEFDVGPQSLLYASVETGFRSGGFSFSTAKPSYGPETLTAFTIGSKNRFFDNRLQLNVEGFYWKYKDQQLGHSGTELNGNPGFFVENVGGSTIKGAEVEAQFLATPTTLLAANVQYLDATNDQFNFLVPAQANPVLSTPASTVYIPLLTGCAVSGPSAGNWKVDCSGLQASRAPKWTMSFGIQQTIPLSSGKIVVGANTRYQSSNYTGFDQLPSDLQSSYWLSNADITYSSEGERFNVSLFMNNIANKQIKLSTAYFSATGLIGATVSDPRTYGVRLGIKF